MDTAKTSNIWIHFIPLQSSDILLSCFNSTYILKFTKYYLRNMYLYFPTYILFILFSIPSCFCASTWDNCPPDKEFSFYFKNSAGVLATDSFIVFLKTSLLPEFLNYILTRGRIPVDSYFLSALLRCHFIDFCHLWIFFKGQLSLWLSSPLKEVWLFSGRVFLNLINLDDIGA